MNDESLFLAALDLPTPVARATYLDAACGGDAERRQRLEELLAAHARSGEFLDVPAGEQVGGTSPVSAAEPPLAPPDLAFLTPPTRPDSLGRVGHYEVLAVIGRGGFGIVLKAFDDTLHRVVAVKVLAPELAVGSPARKRFTREARAAAAVKHENVVQTYAVEEDPLPYLVMEYVPGETLQQRLDRTGPLDAAAVARLGAHIARGLAAAHAAGLVHRDVKPANVIVSPDPVGGEGVKLTDFGLARAADDASLTRSGVIAGTPLYMAPEQARGEEVDARTDLFSLGSVLYALLTGRPPFRAAGTLAVLKRVSEDAPRPVGQIIPEAPAWLVGVIAKLHAKDPAERYQTATEVADDLTRAHSPEPVRRRRWPVRLGGLAALLAVALLAVGGYALTRPLADAAPPTTPSDLPADDSTDRTAALWVFSRGGMVRVNDWGYWINATDLPAGPFRLTGVDLTGNTQLTDDGLATFRDCSHLKHLNLSTTAVTDDGLAHLKGCPRLNTLILSHTGVSDRGLKHLRDVKELAYLQLCGTDVTDGGLSTLAELPRLTSLLAAQTGVTDGGLKAFRGRTDLLYLDLYGTKVTDAGLAHFTACKRLIYLKLEGLTQVTDAGLEAFERCGRLETLLLAGTQVSDKGLASMGKLGQLRRISLAGTAVTGKGLAHLQNCPRLQDVRLDKVELADPELEYLKGCKNLWHLELRGTNTSAAGVSHLGECRFLMELYLTGTQVDADQVAELRRSRPRCWVEWGGKTAVPVTATERTAAEFVLALGGVIRANDLSRDYRGAAARDRDPTLPPNYSVFSAQLGGNAQVTDANLAVFAGCPWLTHLDLSGTAVSDAGLTALTKKGGRRLATLDLADTHLTGSGVAALEALPNLTYLRLNGTPVDDKGLARLQGCSGLLYLDVRRTQVTREAVAAFAAARPWCRVEWDAGTVDPRDVIPE